MEFENVVPKEESTLEKLLSSYKVRQISLWALDMCAVLISFLSSMILTWKYENLDINSIILPVVVYMLIHTMSFNIFKCYSSLWRYAGEEEMVSILSACLAYVIPVYIVHRLMGTDYTMSFNIFKCYSSLWRYAGEEEMVSILSACLAYVIPVYIVHRLMGTDYSILFYLVSTILITGCTGGLRLVYRTGRKLKTRTTVSKDYKRVLIVGAGSAGQMIINELKENPQLKKVPVGIIDDDINKIGRVIHNVKILGNTSQVKEIVEKENVDEIIEKENVDEIILAMANVDKARKSEIINICKETKCKLKTIPGIYEIIDGKVDIKKIRDVEIEDLLGREPIKVNIEEMSGYIQDKTVLVTGGGGSIGSELCRQIASFEPKHLIIVDNYENNAYAIQQELIRKYQGTLTLSTIIASIREYKRMDEIFNEYKPDVVFHAAAHKHVPLMEKSPSEAIKNNIFGTLNVAKLADKYSVKRMVLISTDKAVNPTNIMGATKRAAEMIIQTINKNSETEFVAVRFGNVLGSNGSVIPLFKKQIAEGGPVTITHPDIIRYFMTIPEAVQLVVIYLEKLV